MIAAAFSTGKRRQQKIMKDEFWLDDGDKRGDILYEVSARAVVMQGQSGREVLPGDIGRYACFIDTCSPSVEYHWPPRVSGEIDLATSAWKKKSNTLQYEMRGWMDTKYLQVLARLILVSVAGLLPIWL
jgi:hypothetical protein